MALFPEIKNIDDLLPHIADMPEIVVRKHVVGKRQFTTVCYAISDKNTFATSHARECRGIVFDQSGTVVHRPFHKFFNIGERPEIAQDTLPRSRVVSLQPKLDGSMIGFAYGGVERGEHVWIPKTKKSFQRTELQEAAKTPEYASGAVLRILNAAGPEISLIFELTSPNNRIVVQYPDRHLTLLAARHNISGDYLPQQDLESLASSAGYPRVAAAEVFLNNIVDLAKDHKGLDIEGWVLTLDNGERVKIKTAEYFRAHKTITGLTPKTVLEYWADETLDDTLSFLRGRGFSAEANTIERLASVAQAQLNRTMATVEKFVAPYLTENGQAPASDMKRLALEVIPGAPPEIRHLLFSRLRGTDPDYRHYAKKIIVPKIVANLGLADQRTICGFGMDEESSGGPTKTGVSR